MAGPEETADFAALIRELKDRSGLSYGVLAKRLHMSTSTLHRYCNGDAVPTEYAPVERFARLCKATPDELVEAHRRWILADGARQRERKAAITGTATNTASATSNTASATASPTAAAASAPGAATTTPEPGTNPGTPAPTNTSPSTPAPTGAGAGTEAHASTGTKPPTTNPEPPATSPQPPAPNTPTPHNRRRTTLFAAAAVAVVLAATALVPRLVSGDDGGGDRKQEAGSVTSTGQGTGTGATSAPPKSTSKATSSPSSSTSPSDSTSPSESAKTSGNAAAGTASGGGGGGTDQSAAVPLTVTTRPYAWESPCSQTYLVDEDAAKVPPPPTEQDAPSWVSALGAVSAGSQYLELTVQGTGADTVVLQSLNVRVVGSGAPLARNAYTMGYVGVGCGGGVPTHSFDVGLDATRPVATPTAGQTGLPYKVSESDPEVLYITAAADSHDVRWYLELAWSSGTRHGVLRIDDQGKPFHTSGMNGRPRYGYSLDKSEWVPHQDD
ncbi:helix-turn-helix domain-containing protein [Streptomyces sp. NBC_01239]|uniref:helix-turn-helix domain-containing protein n=1 Tax=Streptomyces sp. NBC_01239 TaxID=2903792 RepID=UPI002250AA57|nr:helix-turn-helix domain-containing protein [Streptomyces sp. NBC_01239]MCX4812006.1 helix-turn-helix domain-containing protein [Streptomyces sp. NBC_01239]